VEAVIGRGETIITQNRLLGDPSIIVYWPLRCSDGNIIGMWAVSKSTLDQNRETTMILLIVIFCSLAIMLILILAASLLGKKIALPIRLVTDYAVQVAKGNLDLPLDVQCKNEIGQLVGALKTMVITLKNLIIEAESQRTAAVDANKAKSSFLSTMSHEIRTPMNAILGITDILLQNETLPPNVREALEKIYTSGDMLLSIINDILDLSKIEAGKLELVVSRYDTASLISDTAQLNMMRIGSKQIEFELNVDENIPANMEGDELRVKQIFNNLLSNAFKYTASGTVKLSISTECNEKDELYMIASVSDTGQGMTKDQVKLLFDEYSRFNMNANRTAEGTGLGMSITRNLINMMGGDIHVDSEPGVGSTFTVRLLQGKCDSEVLGKEVVENLHQFRTSSRANMKRVQISRESMSYGSVLIVDDVETNIYVAKGLLTPYDLKIESADSGYAAIEKIKNGSIYDIIFMDHMMPQMDGVEAAKIIRGMGYEHAIVALTANAVAGQADFFIENGFTDFISKPIDIRQMNIVLNKYIRDKQTPEVIEEARKQAELKKKQASKSTYNTNIDPHLIEIFVRDANKSLAILNDIIEKGDNLDEKDLRTYLVHTHGIKSLLTYMGRMDLSAIAKKLETSGRDKVIDVIKSETPSFVSSLQAFVDELTPTINKEENKVSGKDEDAAYLHEKLLIIKAACEEYDENTADDSVTELKKKTWSQSTNKMLDTIAKHLLHSDFEDAVDVIDNFINVST
jgi:signal transduction histidine kinase/DNA-binding response OmpR family regulator